MKVTETLNNVPKADLARIVKSFEEDGCDVVVTGPENGPFTVAATYEI